MYTESADSWLRDHYLTGSLFSVMNKTLQFFVDSRKRIEGFLTTSVFFVKQNLQYQDMICKYVI